MVKMFTITIAATVIITVAAIVIRTFQPMVNSYQVLASGIAYPLWSAPWPARFSLSASGGIRPPYQRWISSPFRI